MQTSIKALLLEGSIKKNIDAVAAMAMTSSAEMELLMQYFSGEETVLAQRAAWSLGVIAGKQPDLLTPYLHQVTAVLNRATLHETMHRNTLKILEELPEIPFVLHDVLLHHCFTVVEQPKSAIACRVYAFTILCKLAKHYPDIVQELRLLITDESQTHTPFMQARKKQWMRTLEKIG